MKTPKHPRDYEPDELLLLAMVEAFKYNDANYFEIPDCTFFNNSIFCQFVWSKSEQGYNFWSAALNLVPTYHTK